MGAPRAISSVTTSPARASFGGEARLRYRAMNSITVDGEQATTPNIPPVDPTETRQPLVIGVTVTALFLSTLVTALRVYVRARLLRKWGLDDSALVASSVLVFIVGLLMLINTHFGDALHQATLPRDEFLKSQEIAITAVAIYQVAYPLIKSTFLLQYRRVFPLPAFQKLFIRLTTLKSSSTSTDATYNTVIAGIWSITELSCAMICLCVPTLRPLLGGKSSRARPPSYLRPNIEESADTELYTQSDGDGGVKSKTRHSRGDSCEHPTSDHREIHHDVEGSGGGRAPHLRIDLSDVPGILPPPAVHITPYHDSIPYQDSPQRETTIPLTRVETEEGVRFLSSDAPETELPTPLKPPPRRHTDRGPSPEDGGYFGAVVWDASGQPRLPGVSPVVSRSSLVRDKGDSDRPG
ncbi:integral membrane protein [Colletotrichum simmondsii]|uniref:Integral membrane protein n=1 Tax=Colletotrichum simmondsii TaxID=703756 RepID=A0A135T3B2_9PEZI|nr:integral membrane protein [Colletotrichum simmondsii]